MITSSITFNVGAPTVGMRQLCCRYYGASPTTDLPKWDNTSAMSSMILKTDYLVKPSSNTLNVGAPTFSPATPCRGGFTPPSSLSTAPLSRRHRRFAARGRRYLLVVHQ
jgi:hypothetical protein